MLSALVTLALLVVLSTPTLAGPPGAVGDLYVTSWLDDKVVQFDGETGELVGNFVPQGSSGLDGAWGLAWGPNGNLFVCSWGAYCSISGIAEYDGSTGALVRWLVGPDEGDPIPETGWLDEPSYLAFGSDGNLYVSGAINGAVHKYDGQSGEWLGVFAIGGFSPGGLRYPQDLTFGPNGNLFVISGYDASNPTGQGRGIMEYHHATGRLVRPFTEEDHPDIFTPIAAGLLFRPNGNLLLTSTDGDLGSDESLHNEVLEFDGATGELLGAFVADGSGLDWGAGMTWGPNGNLFVASLMGNEVIEYDGETGALVGTFAGVEHLHPMDMAFKPAPADPMPAPTATGVSVSEADACEGLSGVTVTGSNLDPVNTVVKLTAADEPDLVGVVTGGTATDLQVDFNLGGGIAGGMRDVVVVNADGQMDTLAAAIDVAPCYAASEGNLFVLGYRHRMTTRYGLFEFDGASGDLIGFMVEDRSGPVGDDLINTTGFVFSLDGSRLLISSKNPDYGSVLEYDGVTGRKIGTFIPAGTGGMLQPDRLTFGPNGNLFVLHNYCPASGVLEFDGLTGAFVRDFVPLGACGLGYAWDMAFGANDDLYVTIWDEVFRFDGQTGECVGGGPLPLLKPPPPGNGFRSLEFAPHDTDLVLPWWSVPGDAVGRVTVHDPETGELLATPIPPPAGGIDYAYASAFGPPRHLFVAGYPDFIFEYDLLSGAVLGVFATQSTPEGGTCDASEIMFRRRAGDADGDWDLDLSDFARMQQCFGGDGVTPGDYNCFRLDHDRDGDVDLEDAAALSAAMTGPDDCIAPPGACCLPDGSCLDGTTGRECVIELGGEWQGYGSICAEDCPAFGACCLDDGTCRERTAEQCAYAGGDYQGDGTDCATAGCPPAGACCFPDDGSCQEWTETACADLGGMYQGDYTECATTDCPYGIYSNEIDPMTSVVLAGTGLQLADDMTLEGTGARDLEYLDLRVYGGNTGGGDFDVTVELWTDCPGDGGTLIPDAQFNWTGVPDDGYVHILQVDPLSPAVTIPDTVWMVATFSTPESGWIIAEQAETGYTADLFGRNDPPWVCNYYWGGDPYAGLWANLRCVEGQSRARREGEGPHLSITRVEPPLTIEAAR